MNLLDYFDECTFHLRLTTITPMDDIVSFIQNFVDISKYLITHEVTHYHCLLVSKIDLCKRRGPFREYIKETLGLSGNAQIYLSKITSRKTLMKYVLKDDGLYRTNFSEQIISDMKKCSFKKSSNGAFTKALADLEEDWLINSGCTFTFMTNVVKLKAKYNHSISKFALQSYINKMNARRSDSWISNFVSNLDLY